MAHLKHIGFITTADGSIINVPTLSVWQYFILELCQQFTCVASHSLQIAYVAWHKSRFADTLIVFQHCLKKHLIRISFYEDDYALRSIALLFRHTQFALKKVDTFSASFSMSSMKSNMNSPNVSSISPA